MPNQASQIEVEPTTRGPSMVEAVVVGPAEGNRVRVESEGNPPLEAVLAVPDYRPQCRDRVLLALGEGNACWVVGVLVALREVDRSVRAADGACAEVLDGPSGESLVVRDSGGRLLFEYRPGEGRSIVHAPERDLELRAEGNIELLAGEAVRVRGEREVALDGGARPTGDVGANEAGGRLALDARGVTLSGAMLEAKASKVEATFGEVKLVARTLSTLAQKSKQVAGLMEVRVTRLVERAKDVYREAEGLSQNRAGRLKLLAENTVHIFGKRAYAKAAEDFKLDADKIHIG